MCGPENWKNEVEEATVGGKPGVMCGISVRVNGEWVTKHDGAGATDVESIKGGFSDAMKRAAVPWGIGRYLYSVATSPSICVTETGLLATVTFSLEAPKVFAEVVRMNLRNQFVDLEFEEGENPYKQ